MEQTTYFKRRKDMPRQPMENCHDGKGALDWTVVLDEDDLKQRGVSFIHDDILAPGVSIGAHRHEDDEEYYYILSGKGIMTLDQERIEVTGSDITAVYPGGVHGLANTGSEDLHILVFSVHS